MNTVYYNKKAWAIPDQWNEMSGRQLLQVMHHLRPDLGLRDRLQLFKILAGWSWWRIVRLTGMFRYKHLEFLTFLPFIGESQNRYINQCARLWDAVMQCTQFLLESEPELTRNLLPSYQGMHGPADQLSNVRMGEFCFSEFHFVNWKSTGDVSQLNSFVACLYRPAKKGYDHQDNPDGDHREAFNPNLTAGHINKIARWPMRVRAAIALYYQSCREKKIRDYEEVFKDEGGEQSLHGLWSVMREVAKSGHFGDFDKVQDQYVDTILMELKEVHAENERIKDEMDKIKARQ